MKQVIIFDFYKTIFDPITQKLYWGVRLLLKKLSRNNNLVLITTGDRKRKEQIENLNISIYFDEIIVCARKSESVYNKYPNPIIVGDRDDEEIHFAKLLGFRFIKIDAEITKPYKLLKIRLKKYI